MRRVLPLLLLALFSLLAVAGGAGATHSGGSAPEHDFAVGTGQITTETPFGTIEVFLHVNAMSGPSGEDPRGQVVFRGNPPPFPPIDVRGRVTCLRVEGNTSTVGFVITKSKTGFPPEGFGGLFSIVDGGEPGASGDKFEGFPVPPPASCPPPFGGRDITQGNFVVHGAP